MLRWERFGSVWNPDSGSRSVITHKAMEGTVPYFVQHYQFQPRVFSPELDKITNQGTKGKACSSKTCRVFNVRVIIILLGHNIKHGGTIFLLVLLSRLCLNRIFDAIWMYWQGRTCAASARYFTEVSVFPSLHTPTHQQDAVTVTRHILQRALRPQEEQPEMWKWRLHEWLCVSVSRGNKLNVRKWCCSPPLL